VVMSVNCSVLYSHSDRVSIISVSEDLEEGRVGMPGTPLVGWPSANSSIALLIREGLGVCATMAATPSRTELAVNKPKILFIHAKHYYTADYLDTVDVSGTPDPLPRHPHFPEPW
jgi:hypothetical protein